MEIRNGVRFTHRGNHFFATLWGWFDYDEATVVKNNSWPGFKKTGTTPDGCSRARGWDPTPWGCSPMEGFAGNHDPIGGATSLSTAKTASASSIATTGACESWLRFGGGPV